MNPSSQSYEQDSQSDTFRADIYRGIHKGIRAFMCGTLTKVTALDLDDADELADVLAQVKELAVFCADHLTHENQFVHAAMEARQPGSAAETASDHVHHLEAIEQLNSLADTLEHASGNAKLAALSTLQQHLEIFIAENFEHMHFEETHNNAVLWAHYSDEEIVGIEQALVASLPPQDFARCMRWMLIGMSPRERAGMLGGIRDGAPPPVFESVLATARGVLNERDWNKLANALCLDERLAA